MPKYHIDAPVSQVAKYLPDYMRIPDPEGSLARSLADAMGMDETQTEVRRTGPNTFEATRHLGDSGRTSVTVYTLSPEGSGTRIDLDVTVDGKRPNRLQRVAAAVALRGMNAEVKAFEQHFKSYIAERENGGPALG